MSVAEEVANSRQQSEGQVASGGTLMAQKKYEERRTRCGATCKGEEAACGGNLDCRKGVCNGGVCTG